MSQQERQRDRQMLEAAMLRPAPLTVHFDYLDARGNITSRHAEPYHLTASELWAFCRDRKSTRRFKINGVGNVRHGEAFKPQWPVKVDQPSDAPEIDDV